MISLLQLRRRRPHPLPRRPRISLHPLQSLPKLHPHPKASLLSTFLALTFDDLTVAAPPPTPPPSPPPTTQQPTPPPVTTQGPPPPQGELVLRVAWHVDAWVGFQFPFANVGEITWVPQLEFKCVPSLYADITIPKDWQPYWIGEGVGKTLRLYKPRNGRAFCRCSSTCSSTDNRLLPFQIPSSNVHTS